MMAEESNTAAVSREALEALASARGRIIDRVVERSLARTEHVAHLGDDAERVIRAGIEMTTRMIESTLSVGSMALLDDQLAWAMSRLPHDGVPPEHIVPRLRTYREAVNEFLAGGHAAEITPVIDWLIARLQELIDEAAGAEE